MEDSTHSGTSSKGATSQNISAILGNADIDVALQFWKQFDLSQTRNRWDKTCNEMREMKTASINGRKRLVDLTKAFRAKPKEEQIASISELLKAYQEEIDQLSRRSKLSETSFLAVFKALYEAPDPGLYLEQLLQSILNSNTHTYEIQRLKAELAQYEEEFQHLKNQEVTIRRLEDQLQEFNQNNELKILEEVERRTEIIREECQQEVLESKELQKSVERRLSLALESAKQAQAASDRAQSQLLEVSTKYEEKLSALLTENSLLADNIQRLQLRCNEMETENEQYRKGSNVSPTPFSPTLANESDKQGSYEALLSQLRSELQEKEERYRLEKLSLETSLRDIQHQHLKEKEASHKLKQELLERPSKQDYSQLRKRLKLVERIAFHSANEDHRGKPHFTEEDDEDTLEDAIGPENTSDPRMIPLENLLTTKVQGLEKELLSLRKRNLELKETETTQREIVANLKLSLENKHQIIQRLEKELESRNNALERMIKEQNAKKENTLTDLAVLIGVKEDGAGRLLGTNDSSSRSVEGGETTSGERSDAVKQMIDVLTNQRDRYKERLTQAEAKLLKTEEMLEAMTTAKSRLEEENLQLYAKIKFLQNYSQSSTTSKASSGASRHRSFAEESRYSLEHQDPYYRHLSSSLMDADDIESKYDHLYEQRMNPFAEFSLHEKQRKLRELSVADRIVLNTTLAIVQSNVGRNFLLVYLGAMHLLVFVTIYYTAHNVHHGCDPSLDHIAASSAAALHGSH